MDIEKTALTEHLAELGDARATGLLMVFADAQVATMGFADGELRLLMYRGKTGLEATHAFAEALQPLQKLQVRFRQGAVSDRNADLPDLTAVSQILCPHAGLPARSDAPHERNVVPLTADMQPIIVAVASVFIGDSAGQICQDLFSRTDRLRVVFLLLSGYIVSPEKAQEFRHDLREHLRPLTAAYTKNMPRG